MHTHVSIASSSLARHTHVGVWVSCLNTKPCNQVRFFTLHKKKSSDFYWIFAKDFNGYWKFIHKVTVRSRKKFQNIHKQKLPFQYQMQSNKSKLIPSHPHQHHQTLTTNSTPNLANSENKKERKGEMGNILYKKSFNFI